MKHVFLIFTLLCFTFSFSQKQTAFWYFGDNAGLNFNSGSPIALTNGELQTTEGCATISDFNGNLLFYTDGITVWNKAHLILQNGTNLHGDFSSTNSAIIIPKPEDDSLYYIFTVDDIGGAHGLQYSIVDMNLDNGLGAITMKNILLTTPVTEKITAVKHQNDIDWWVLIHKWESDEFLAYLVTSSGINSPIITRIGTNITGSSSNTIGAMKFSPDGTKIALANSYDLNQVQLFDFNDVTGEISNPISFNNFDGTRGAYGVEFSIDSNLLYVTDSGGSIYQYNTSLILDADIINSRITIIDDVLGLGALQIAPNGKIYVARENSTYLGVITNPNTIGINCNYINDGVFLEGRTSKFGLPPFIQSFFWKEIIVEQTCLGDTTTFSLVNPEFSQTWDFGDLASGVANNSTLANPSHTYTAPGTYTVSVESTDFLGTTTTSVIHITISELPIVVTPQDYELCDDGIDNNGFNQSFLLITKDSEIIGNINPSQFDVLYYQDRDLTIPISKNIEYENNSPFQQTVFAKVFNKDNDLCFASTEFKLIVNPKPEFYIQNEITVCTKTTNTINISSPLDNYNYEWLDNNGNSISVTQSLSNIDTSTITQEGVIFSVTATNPNTLCQRTKEINIRKSSIATITDADITSVAFSSPSNSIEILTTNLGAGDYEFSLQHSSDDHTWQNEPIFTNLQGGRYIVLVRDKNGCGQTSLEVDLIDFPTFFTPNNDGENDTWSLLNINNTTRFSTGIVNVFDRYGKLIAQISPLSNGWDGTYNGKKMPATDYWFTVDLIDNTTEVMKPYNGHFSLIRR